jgi:esterase/lipase superfamily enzyme
MSGDARALSCALVGLSLIGFDPAQAQMCRNVDRAAHEPLREVSLPPKNSCEVRLSNGFPIPDPSCTPGAVNPTVTLDVLRDPAYRTSCAKNRRASSQQRTSVYDWYRIGRPRDDGANPTCDLDRLIPLELGGTDTPDNIWPQCGPPGVRSSQRYFKQKDLVEKYLVAQVKSGEIDLAEAQRGIAADWTQYLDEAQDASTLPRRHPGYSYTPSSPSPGADQQMVDLLIASTRGIQRIPQPTKTQLELIPDERREPLSFGAARIRVPEGHRLGRVERPHQVAFAGITFYRTKEDEKRHFTVKSTRWLTQDDFIDAVKSRAESNQAQNADQALIFVHGFNTSFEDGLFRLAQIVWDTQFRGTPILFSWPSKGNVLSYEFDHESATFSVTGFRELVNLLQGDTSLSAIHIIAHSMGNWIVVDALANPRADIQQKALGQLLLAAPDVDRDVFKDRESRIAGFRGITLYASSADKALQISHRIAEGVRAGDIPRPPDGPVVLPNMDTIDATAIGHELFGLNHNSFASSRSAISDIGRLVADG